MTIEYFEPHSLGEALSLLDRFKGEAKILAGGTDLLVQMRRKKIAPRCLISIQNIPGLDRMEEEDGAFCIGARATIADLEDSSILRDRFPVLHEAVRELGTQQVKNLATLGGNLCHASPAADSAPPLIALKASAKIASIRGERGVPLVDFFLGPGRTALEPGEMLAEIHIPFLSSDWKGTYLKHGLRKKLETAIVGIALLVHFDPPAGILKDLVIGMGAVCPTPRRALQAEELARGRRMGTSLFEKIASLAAEESAPITDVRATAEYRREMVGALVRKALEKITGL